jgi:hypothetical protein
LEAGEQPSLDDVSGDVKSLDLDDELRELAGKVETLLQENPALKEQFEQAQTQVQRRIQLDRDKSQGYQFNEKVDAQFIGGNHNHYHGVDSQKEH